MKDQIQDVRDNLRNVKITRNRGWFVAIGIIILVGLLITFLTIKDMRSPGWHVIINLVLSVAYAYIAYVFLQINDGEAKSGGIPWGFIVCSFLYIGIVWGVGLVANENRKEYPARLDTGRVMPPAPYRLQEVLQHSNPEAEKPRAILLHRPA